MAPDDTARSKPPRLGWLFQKLAREQISKWLRQWYWGDPSQWHWGSDAWAPSTLVWGLLDVSKQFGNLSDNNRGVVTAHICCTEDGPSQGTELVCFELMHQVATKMSQSLQQKEAWRSHGVELVLCPHKAILERNPVEGSGSTL